MRVVLSYADGEYHLHQFAFDLTPASFIAPAQWTTAIEVPEHVVDAYITIVALSRTMQTLLGLYDEIRMTRPS